VLIVHAGHRIDASTASRVRFPPAAEERVSRRLGDLLDVLRPAGVVTAAAAGADLLLAEEALRRNVPVHVVLPLDRSRFRASSVADRGAQWADRYDDVLARVAIDPRSSIVELDHEGDDEGFRAGNAALLERAVALGDGQVIAVAVRRSNGETTSVTDDFVERARERDLFVIEIDPVE
jgi:hypothetical protein